MESEQELQAGYEPVVVRFPGGPLDIEEEREADGEPDDACLTADDRGHGEQHGCLEGEPGLAHVAHQGFLGRRRPGSADFLHFPNKNGIRTIQSRVPPSLIWNRSRLHELNVPSLPMETLLPRWIRSIPMRAGDRSSGGRAKGIVSSYTERAGTPKSKVDSGNTARAGRDAWFLSRNLICEKPRPEGPEESTPGVSPGLDREITRSPGGAAQSIAS